MPDTPPYAFDDIRPAVELLADLHAELYLQAEAGPTVNNEDYLPGKTLDILGALRHPLNEYDGHRLDQLLEKIIETKLRAHELKKKRR